MGIKNRNKKRLSGKHCLSYGHSIAEISYGPLTPLLAYSYGKWIDLEYQLIFKWLFLMHFSKIRIPTSLWGNIVKCNSNFSKYLVSTTLWQTQSIKNFNGKRILYRNKLKIHRKSLAKCLGTYFTNNDREKRVRREGKERSVGRRKRKGNRRKGLMSLWINIFKYIPVFIIIFMWCSLTLSTIFIEDPTHSFNILLHP